MGPQAIWLAVFSVVTVLSACHRGVIALTMLGLRYKGGGYNADDMRSLDVYLGTSWIMVWMFSFR